MKISLKHVIALILIFTILFGTTACSRKDAADDQNTLSFTLSAQPWGPPFVEALEKKFPDINFDVEYYYGPNYSEYIRTQLAHDDFGDIYISTVKNTEEECVNHLLNLSGFNFVGNFEDSMLNQYDMNGAIYELPCIVTIRTMAYNKSLFKEKGWKVPTNHGELVALCKQIRAESNLTPISFAGKSLGYYFTTLTTLAQTDFLTTREGAAWEKAYLEGNASCKEGFEPGVSMLQELIDANAYDIHIDEKIPGDLQIMERFADRKSAMVAAWSGQTELVDMMTKAGDEVGLFPFYNRDGQALLGTHVSNSIGISKKLGEKGNEKKLENVLRIMEWLSTEEGMSYLRSGRAEILTLKGVDNAETIDVFRDVWEENLAGMKAPMLYTGYEDIMIDIGQMIKNAMKHNTKLDGLIETADQLHQNALSSPDSAILGSIDENLNHAELVQLITNIMQSRGLADISLLSAGGRQNGVPNYTGVYGKLYAGDITKINYYIPLPNRYNSPLVVKKLTGAEIANLLENGRIVNEEVNGKTASAAFDYYWAGMNVEMKDGKVKSMTLSDGTKMNANDTFTVLFAPDDYVGAGTPDDDGIKQKETPEQIYLEYLKHNNPIKKPKVLRQQ